ncbi:MAG: Holliday junction resolvase RecU [Lachnospiraceae bacterium]|nr:Holliday junction resolvase RecU [Lachnospiraceae bacterium]
MATWKTRGLRGSLFEDLINRTNEVYLERGTALVQKIPTPITPIDFDQEERHITLAYFNQKSTVDYIGIAQGIALCFDCKECAADTFAMQNIHEHQYKFMKEFERQGGVAFILIYYSHREQIYFMRCEEMAYFYERAYGTDGQSEGRKSFRFDELDPDFLYDMPAEPFINYLEYVNDYLDFREREGENVDQTDEK